MEKSKKFVGVAFIVIVVAFMLSVAFRFAVRDYVGVLFDWMEPIASEENDSNQSNGEWAKKYPFDTCDDYEIPNEDAQVTIAEDNSFLSKINTAKESVDYYTTNLLIGRIKFVETNAKFNKLVGNNIVTATDSVTLMKNGYLTFVSDRQDTSFHAESLKWFNEKMEEKGIDFMYVQYPSKVSVKDNQLPAGTEDNDNANIDSLLEGLKNSDVKVLDFRCLLESREEDYYGSFFKTDHHWKTETGVWASGEIVKALNDSFGYSLDESIGELSNYKAETFEKFCFGSQGKIATLSFAEPEDISIYYPKEKTDYTVVYDEIETKNGNFEDTLINRTVFDKPDYYSVSTYSAYLFGGSAVINIKNNSLSNGKRLVFVTDSYGNCVAPYISQLYEYVDVIDLRKFDGSLMNYIGVKSPDTVLVGCNPSVITEEKSHNSMFNFK